MRGDDGEGCFCVLMISSLSTLKKEKIKSLRVFQRHYVLVNFIWPRVVFAERPPQRAFGHFLTQKLENAFVLY